MIKRKLILLVILIGMLLGFLGYFLLAFYYRRGFGLNTWINGIYCTGKSVEEVNSELLRQTKAPIIQITDKDGKNYHIDLKDAGYEADYRTALNRYMQEQNPYLWTDYITLHRNYNLQPNETYDRDALKELFCRLEPVADQMNRPVEFSLSRNEEQGWVLKDGFHNRMDEKKAFEVLVEKVNAGEREISLEELGGYYDLPLTKEHENLQALYETVEDFQKWNVIYDMGTEEFFWSPGQMAYFIETDSEGLPLLDKNGQVVLDEDAVKEAVEAWADAYDTYGKTHKFMSTRGKEMLIDGGTYGNLLNRKKETAFLTDNLLKEELRTGETQYHVPEYDKMAKVQGKNDIGDTYVEVDMTQQKLYYYEEGELLIECDIVTGDMAKKRSTPEGVSFVYSKARNCVLRGRDYVSPVKYWMPVNGNIGLHDADWRSEFGGSIYLEDGSHGCVNMPDDAIKELYEKAEIGLPVIMFY
ncbi:MAG: L,D-transpeptidase [Lachnoclostridium sp.]|nr:L,D-transpeptidase [Lachnospira sp.]MCM1249083.1 L,D-transpeptidase [Lachnoclostridium sp.]MCM1536594.1 L,D-transpeptidase [Clostridium sp.]